MIRFTVLAAIAAAILSFGIAAVASAQVSPTPQPTGTTAPNLCTGTPQRGGATIQAINGASVTPPGGGTFVIGTNPRGESSSGTAFTVCFVEGNARVTISSSDCDEISRENPADDPGADFVLDLIVDSCERTAPTATPTPASRDDDDDATPTPTRTSEVLGTISPPSTGGAGLK